MSTKTELEKLSKENLIEMVLRLEKIASQNGCDAEVGDIVSVVGFSSWEGWEGYLERIDPKNDFALVSVWRAKKEYWESCPTSLSHVRFSRKGDKNSLKVKS